MRPSPIFRATLGLLVLAALLGPRAATALPVLDFGLVAPTPGTIAYAGGATPLHGSGIQVDNVVGLETPAGDGTLYAVLGGTLAFSTGALTSTTATKWLFSPGGSLTLSGVVDVNGNGQVDASDPGIVLLTGTFIGPTDVTMAGSTIRVLATAFSATVNPEVAALYGLGAGDLWDGAINLSFVTTRRPPAGFTTSQLLSGDIALTGAVPVPEASTLFILGVGMVALGMALGRRPRAVRVRVRRNSPEV